MIRTITFALLIALGIAFTASPASAADTSGAPVLANYWSGFIDHWTGVFQKQNGIVMGALLVGVVCLFIITRGKWKK